MAWFMTLYKHSGAEKVFTLVDGANIDDLESQFAAASGDDIVRVPARMNDQMREAPLFVRPIRWDAWRFFHHDGEQLE